MHSAVLNAQTQEKSSWIKQYLQDLKQKRATQLARSTTNIVELTQACSVDDGSPIDTYSENIDEVLYGK